MRVAFLIQEGASAVLDKLENAPLELVVGDLCLLKKMYAQNAREAREAREVR